MPATLDVFQTEISWLNEVAPENIPLMAVIPNVSTPDTGGIWRYVMVYYNRKRICTVNEGGWPPSIYREKVAAQEKAA